MAHSEVRKFDLTNLTQDSQSVATTPISTPSNTPTKLDSFEESPKQPKIKIYKVTIDQVLNQYFTIDSSKFDIVSNELFYFIQRQLHHKDTDTNTQTIIDSINASLSKHAVDRFSKRLPSQDQDTATNGIDFEDDIKSKLDAALERFFNQSQESLTDQKKATLTSMLAYIATDIATNGFFNPSSIADSNTNQLVAAFIQSINDPSLPSAEVLPIEPAINVENTNAVSRQLFPNKHNNRPSNIQKQVLSALSCVTVCALALYYTSGSSPDFFPSETEAHTVNFDPNQTPKDVSGDQQPNKHVGNNKEILYLIVTLLVVLPLIYGDFLNGLFPVKVHIS